MQKNFRHILVTGATGILGRLVVERFLSCKYNVTGTSTGRQKEVIHQLARFAKKQKNKVRFSHIVTDFKDPTKLQNQLRNREILQNATEFSHAIFCHGVNFIHPILEVTPEQIIESMNLNFLSVLVIAQHLGRAWEKTISPDKKLDRSMVFVSSVAVHGGAPDELAYHSAKRAAESAWLAFARWGAPLGIRFNVISPGLMAGPMSNTVIQNRPTVLERIPLGHVVNPKNVVEGIKLLIENKDITGEKLHINCGRIMDI